MVKVELIFNDEMHGLSERVGCEYMLRKIFLEEVEMLLEYFSRITSDWDKLKIGSMFREEFLSTGKMLRPILTIISSKAVGGKPENALPGALAVEIIHNSSLIHDDIIDKAEIRRGKPTFYRRHGLTPALLVADFSFSMVVKAILMINNHENMRKVFEILSKATAYLADGEYLDSTFNPAKEPLTLSKYMEIAYKKTAYLFKSATEIGAILGGGKEKEINALKAYGLNLGLAFQIQDDVLDFTGNVKVTGKDPLRDSLLGRPSYPLIYILKGMNVDEAISFSKEKNRELIEKAVSSLDGIGKSEEKEKLINLALYSAERLR